LSVFEKGSLEGLNFVSSYKSRDERMMIVGVADIIHCSITVFLNDGRIDIACLYANSTSKIILPDTFKQAKTNKPNCREKLRNRNNPITNTRSDVCSSHIIL
jgi:hypothetical protein